VVVFDGTNYLVVWDDFRVSGTPYIYGQFVSTSGTLVGSEISISTNPGRNSSVLFDGGNHLVAWDINGFIRGQFISTAGNLIGSEFIINTKQQTEYNPVGMAFDGTNYLVTWHDKVSGSGGAVVWDLFGQFVDTSGILVGGVISVTTDSGTQLLPMVAFDGTNFLVTWTDASNDVNGDLICDAGEGTCIDVYGLYINTVGSQVGSKFAINTDLGNQFGFLAGYDGGKYFVLINEAVVTANTLNAISSDVYGQFITPTAGTLSGTVSGTGIFAVNDNGEIVASDDTTGKTPDPITGNFDFTLTGIPVDMNIRVYLVTGSGVYPLYFGTPSTNVFSLSAVATIDLGFVDTSSGQAIPENDPTAIAEVSEQAENTATPVLPGGTLTVNVTDDADGTALLGASVIVDHASDPRQVDTTTAAGIASFTTPSSGPVTVTIGMSGYELVTIVDINIATISVTLGDLNQLAFVQGTASNYTGPGIVTPAFNGTGDWWEDGCPSCENLYEETAGFYRLGIELPNTQYALSAFDGDINNPINFTAVTGIGPLTDGQILTVNLIFPAVPPATTITTGTITVPISLGAISEVSAIGTKDLGDQGKLIVGFSPDTVSPYPYTLTTFAFTGGTSDDIAAWAEGTGGDTFSIQRGVGFGGSGVDFNLIELPTNLSPTGSCGGTTPTLSWTAVPGASFYVARLEGMPSDWEIVIDGGSTSIALPDLTGTDIAVLGLSSGVPVNWYVQAIVVPDYNFNTISEDTVRRIMTDRSGSADVICTPP